MTQTISNDTINRMFERLTVEEERRPDGYDVRSHLALSHAELAELEQVDEESSPGDCPNVVRRREESGLAVHRREPNSDLPNVTAVRRGLVEQLSSTPSVHR